MLLERRAHDAHLAPTLLVPIRLQWRKAKRSVRQLLDNACPAAVATDVGSSERKRLLRVRDRGIRQHGEELILACAQGIEGVSAHV